MSTRHSRGWPGSLTAGSSRRRFASGCFGYALFCFVNAACRFVPKVAGGDLDDPAPRRERSCVWRPDEAESPAGTVHGLRAVARAPPFAAHSRRDCDRGSMMRAFLALALVASRWPDAPPDPVEGRFRRERLARSRRHSARFRGVQPVRLGDQRVCWLSAARRRISGSTQTRWQPTRAASSELIALAAPTSRCSGRRPDRSPMLIVSVSDWYRGGVRCPMIGEGIILWQS